MSKEPKYEQEDIEVCKSICAAAGWQLVGTEEWDFQYLCHPATGKILRLLAEWSSVGSMWDCAVNLIIKRSYRS